MCTYRFTRLFAGLCIIAAVSQPASGTYGHGATPADDEANLDLKMTGFIKPHCHIHISDEKLWIEISDEPGSAIAEFNVNCNQYMNVEITSRNGGMLHEASARIPDYEGFTAFIPYDLNFSVKTSDAKSVKFQSEDIKETPGRGSIKTIPYEASGDLTISWAPDEYLIAGEYHDVIEIRVTGD